MKRKVLLAPRGAIAKIAKELGVSRQWVGLCLKGAVGSELAAQVRETAKRYGCR